MDELDRLPTEVLEAAGAIKYGAVWRGFDGPDGITKDEALEYAAVLAEWVFSLESDGRQSA